jgi:hypothetical protein
MPIEEHKNVGLEDVRRGGAGNIAAGSSNSNSHNAGGGGELTRPELEQVMRQLSEVLPQIQELVKAPRNAPR